MATRLEADNGRHVLIRPLAYCLEEDIARFAEAMAFPIIPCNLCGSQENLKRKRMKALIGELSSENPKVRGNMLSALGNVVPTHLLDPLLQRQEGALSEETSRFEGWRAADGGRKNTTTGVRFPILKDR
jgi:tRNA 2-thiocytidine biosynthesis protein TtcA